MIDDTFGRAQQEEVAMAEGASTSPSSTMTPAASSSTSTSSEPSSDPFNSKSSEQIEEEESILRRKLTVLGTDVGDIPCFRNSFLYGIGGGIGIGLAHFALSSKIQKATKFGFWSYVGITSAYWVKCRYEYTMIKQEYARLQYAMKHVASKDGTKDAMQRDPHSDVS